MSKATQPVVDQAMRDLEPPARAQPLTAATIGHSWTALHHRTTPIGDVLLEDAEAGLLRSAARFRRWIEPITSPVATSSAANSLVILWRR